MTAVESVGYLAAWSAGCLVLEMVETKVAWMAGLMGAGSVDCLDTWSVVPRDETTAGG